MLLFAACSTLAPPVPEGSDPETAAVGAEEYDELCRDAWSVILEGDYAPAVNMLNLTVELQPGNALAYAYRGEAYRMLSKYAAAAADLDRALALRPADAFTLERRGEVYRLTGDFERALDSLSAALDLDLDSYFAYASRGQIYWELEDQQRALADLDKAISLDPGYTWAIERRSELLQEMRAAGSSAGTRRADASVRSGSSTAFRLGPLPLVTVLDFAIENLPASEGRLIVDLLASALV